MSGSGNNHFVPEHFLRAWSVDVEKTKTNRYKLITHTGKVKFRLGVSIRFCASEEDLYLITDGVDSAEFETTVMTDQLDTPGARVIEKLRANGLGSLSRGEGVAGVNRMGNELLTLAKYTVCLEARNPKTIKKMRLSRSDLDMLRSRLSPYVSSPSLHQALELFGKIDTGRYAAGLFTSDEEFAKSILRCHPLELTFSNGCLVSSSYPVGRIGDYREQFSLSLAVAPNYAIMWFTDINEHT